MLSEEEGKDERNNKVKKRGMQVLGTILTSNHALPRATHGQARLEQYIRGCPNTTFLAKCVAEATVSPSGQSGPWRRRG